MALWPEARAAIMLAMSYAPEIDPLARLADSAIPASSRVYALGRDYHDVVKGKLKHLAAMAGARDRCRGEGLRRYRTADGKAACAQKPVLGWQGKHTNLVSRELGSWFFLGAILSAADLASRCSRERSLRLMPRLSRHLSDQGLPCALSARCAPLHFLSHHRA